jgi:cell wall-associated NlpC family hydrolase
MKKLLTLLSGLLLVVIFSCNKDENESLTVFDDPEALSETEIQTLENLNEAEGFDSSTVILPNGENLYDFLMEVDPDFANQWLKSANINSPYENLGPQDARNLLIARMTAVALNLTDKTKHQYPNEGDDKPAQNGLAYSWGGKNHKVRQKPPGANTACNHKIYGLDCSGFVYQVFQNAGVNMKIGPANAQRMPDYVEGIIKSSIPELDKIKVEDLGSIPTSEFESGDIIFWTNSSGRATHIGIILKKGNGSLAVFQSNGSPGYNSDDCTDNLSTNRGLRRLELNDAYWFGSSKNYGITRINADLSGNWSLYLRCAGQSVDVISFQLEFPTSSENTFEVTGTGTDYDGAPFNCKIDMTYNNSTNVLSGTSYMTKPSVPDFYRYDSFSVKLNRDETEYFSWTLGDSQDAGCELEGRLINNENSSEKSAIFESKTVNGNIMISTK